jgi:hypothetical protein
MDQWNLEKFSGGWDREERDNGGRWPPAKWEGRALDSPEVCLPCYTVCMGRTAEQTLDITFLEMRARALALAADLDRIQRLAGGSALLQADDRIAKLRRAFELLMGNDSNRAEQLQLIFSDTTPPPQREAVPLSRHP